MDYSGQTRAVRPLTREDDFDHPVEPHEYFNESRYLHLIDAEQQIGGWFRIGRRPNQGYAEMTVCLYLPGGRVAFAHARPAIGDEAHNSAAGLSFEVVEPMQHQRVRFAGPVCLMTDGRAMESPRAAFKQNPMVDCAITLDVHAIAPAHGGELLGDDGRPFDEGEGRYFARAHYDQSLRGSGQIRVGSENFSIQGFGLRDHSWGPRIWQAIPWYRWFPCTFGEDFAICLLMVRKADGEYLETGYVHDGSGTLRHAANLKLKTSYDEHHYPRSFELSFVDDLNRPYTVHGETLNAVPCRHTRPLPDGRSDVTRIMESLTRYTCNGRVGHGLAEYMDHVHEGVFEGIAAGF